VRLTLSAAGLEVKNYALLTSSKNFYNLGTPSQHTAMDGSKCPAKLKATAEALVLTLNHAKGDIVQTFTVEGEEMVMVIVLSRGGTEVLRMRRVNSRVKE